MVKTPEEYFEDHLFDVVHSEPSKSFTVAEAAFMSKYLGVNEAEALERLGMEKAIEPECVLSLGDDPSFTPRGTGSPELKVQTEQSSFSATSAAVETVPESLVAQSAGSDAKAAVQPVKTTSEQVAKQLEQQVAVSAEEPCAAEELDVLFVEAEESSQKWLGAGLTREPDLLEQLRAESELQMVSFFLGKQEFTVPISTVQEVIRYIVPTKLPVAPQFVRGVVNLRGIVTPIIQLRTLLGITCDDEAVSKDKFIVVCKRHGLQFGLVIDSVHTMYRVPQSSIDWAVESHLGAAVQYIFGLMKSDDMLIGIISVDNIVDSILEG